MKRYFTTFFITALFITTLVSLPHIDYVEPNVFFYLEHLPPIYYLCVLASIAVAFFSRQRLTRVLSVCVLGLLIIWTPSIMLVQPLYLDSYPFVAEAVYVARNGHLGNFHYLSENPALGLAFGSYLLITGVSPLTLLKIFPALLVTFTAVLVYVIAKKSRIGEKPSVVASLLFISILWPNVFHVCRQAFSLIYYFLSLFLVFQLIFQRFDRRIVVLLSFQIILLAMSHPATPLFFIYNMALMAVFGWFSQKIRSRELKFITYTLITSVIIWLLWNMIGTSQGIIYTIKEISQRVVNSLIENPSEVSGVTKIFMGRTPIYRMIIDIRLFLTFLVYLCSFIVPLLLLVVLRNLKDWKRLLMLTGWGWSNMSITVPMLYAGLPYFAKPAFFAIAAWGSLVALVFTKEIRRKLPLKIGKILSVFLVVFVMGSSLLIPLTKYAPLPLEYASSRELAGQRFLDLYGGGSGFVYSEDPAYLYSYILGIETSGVQPTDRLLPIFVPDKGINASLFEEESLWTTNRVIVRQAFWHYSPSMQYSLENLTRTLSETTHNKLYDSGWPEYIFIPRSKPK